MGNWFDVEIRWRRVTKRRARRIAAFIDRHLDDEGGAHVYQDGASYSVDEWPQEAVPVAVRRMRGRILSTMEPLRLDGLTVEVVGETCGRSDCYCRKPGRTCWGGVPHPWDFGIKIGRPGVVAFVREHRNKKPVQGYEPKEPRWTSSTPR